MGAHNQNFLQSKVDQTVRISKSVFVSNFPEGCTAKDLWKVCNDYGTVVDVFIPTKKSKVGKRFAFVRFIKVINLDRLIENLNTIWIGRFHLFANLARFERPKKPNLSSHNNVAAAPSYPRGVDQAKGGLCVMIELTSSKSKAKFLKHVGVASWFNCLSNAQSDFVSRDRIVWVDIEGVPMHVWSSTTFHKIGSKWGEVLDIEECKDDFFARKRICIKTNQEDNILEKFKIIVKGKIFVVRAKELFTWSPTFTDVSEMAYCSDDDSDKEVGVKQSEFCKQGNSEDESDNEAVSDTFYGENTNEEGYVAESVPQSIEKEISNDPFKIYDLLNKRKEAVDITGTDSSIPFPPGFTPDKGMANEVEQDMQVEQEQSHSKSIGSSSRIMESAQKIDKHFPSEAHGNGLKHREGGSILEVLEEMIKVGQTMGFSMEGCNKDMEKIIGSQGVHEETKMENISAMDVKFLWGNSNFDYIFSEALGNSGGILCTWDPNVFQKEHHIISDNFVALCGNWIPNQKKILMISVYAPQAVSNKRVLWTYLTSLINRWNGESIVMGDFNEVRRMEERWGSTFNVNGARAFNNFISNSGLVDLQLEGYTFTWAHPSATKMSKLDRFLVTDGLLSLFPHVSAACLDRHLSDHRPILLREVFTDYGATPFRFYHSWFSFQGFEHMVTNTWNSTILNDSNRMIRFKKKLQILKKEIRVYVADQKKKQLARVNDLKSKLSDIDRILDQGGVNDDLLLSRTECMNNLQDVKAVDARDSIQKAKIQWAVEGDENSKFFHGIVNRKRANLAVKGIMIDGDWVDDPSRVKDEFRNHFAARFQDPGICHGCNSSFIALIPKSLDPKSVCNYRPISLIGSMYKVITKILATRLSVVISDLISDVQTAFLLNQQILDGPFIINELLARCHHKKQRAMVFKVDFAKAYDSIRWDYLEDVLHSFGFGSKWRSWIRGCLNSRMASILVNGSRSEYQFHRGLKQKGILWLIIWIWDLNGDGEFCVKDVRNLLDVTFLPKADSPTRWIKTIPIKVNIFAWKVSLDRLPTRSNLARRGVLVPSSSCLICNVSDEDLAHLLFRCDLAIEVTRLVYRWWNLVWIPTYLGFLGSRRCG
ncbi:RNA-directed DNA polymerase, eukaryota [Tanacetum coccineum]